MLLGPGDAKLAAIIVRKLNAHVNAVVLASVPK